MEIESTAQRQPLLLPRALIFYASLWLIVSWLLAMGVRAPLHPTAASFTPGVALMILCMTLGLVIGWPMLRLSETASPYPMRQTWLDLVVLVSLTQVVVWPLRLVTSWSPYRTAAIDATIVGWLVLIGAVIASAIGSHRRGPRNLAMLICLCMALLAPALVWLGAGMFDQWLQTSQLSPLLAVHYLSTMNDSRPTQAHWRWIGLLWVAAVLAWILLPIAMSWTVRRDKE